MSKERYEIDEQTGEILDNHFVLTPEDIVDRLNYLEEQLKNAIVPKFKGEDVAFRVNIFTKDIERVVIVSTKIEIICNINISYTIACLGKNQTLANIDIRNIIEDFGTYISQEREEDLFATKEEALAKLEELKGENK